MALESLFLFLKSSMQSEQFFHFKAWSSASSSLEHDFYAHAKRRIPPVKLPPYASFIR